jgi:hypothetical protein
MTHTIFHAHKRQNEDFKKLALIAKDRHFPTQIPAMLWGTEKEPVAMGEYARRMQLQDSGHRIQHFGLILDANFPAFGGSPDGVGIHANGKRYLIEIKCPYKFRTGSLVRDGVEQLTYLDTGPSLRETHSYYFQIQTLMGIMSLDMARLVIWCPKDMIVIDIQADPHFYARVRENCIDYYCNTYLKHIFRE